MSKIARGEGTKVQTELDHETHLAIVAEKMRRRGAKEPNASVELIVKETLDERFATDGE